MKAKLVNEKFELPAKDTKEILNDFADSYVYKNIKLNEFFEKLQQQGFTYGSMLENKKDITNSILKSMRKSLNRNFKKIENLSAEKYTLKSTVKKASMGYGSFSSDTTWDLYDSDGKLVKSHNQNSWSDDKLRDWKAFVRKEGINPKDVKKI